MVERLIIASFENTYSGNVHLFFVIFFDKDDDVAFKREGHIKQFPVFPAIKMNSGTILAASENG